MDIPVFTASKKPVAHIKQVESKAPIVASEQHPLLSFATNGDGSAGRNFVFHNRPFYINVDRIAIDVIDGNILLPYLYSPLFDMKEKYKFGHSHKANKHNLASVRVDVPISESGDFNIVEQSMIAEQFLVLHDMRAEIVQKCAELTELVVEPPYQYEVANSKVVSLSEKELFEMSIGKRLLKKDFFQKDGTLPAYSANVLVPFAFVEETNIEDFTSPYVIWGIDGDFDFNIIETGVKFATTDHCGAIKVKSSSIDPVYLMYSLKRAKHKYGFDRGLRASLTNMKKIEITIPIDQSGSFDLGIQHEIARGYLAIEQYKREILDKLNTLLEYKISY